MFKSLNPRLAFLPGFLLLCACNQNSIEGTWWRGHGTMYKIMKGGLFVVDDGFNQTDGDWKITDDNRLYIKLRQTTSLGQSFLCGFKRVGEQLALSDCNLASTYWRREEQS